MRAEGLLASGGGGEGGRWASFCREIVGLLLLQLRLRIPVAIGLSVEDGLGEDAVVIFLDERPPMVVELEEAPEDVGAQLAGEAEGLHGLHRPPPSLLLGDRPRRTHPSLLSF